MTYRVLVVEDEALAAEAHAHYVGRLSDFELVGVARSGREAVGVVDTSAVDLILLDMHLPDGHGLEVLRALRAAGCTSDVIAVTSARELEVVKRAVAQGVLAYLLKPFTFAGFRAKLDRYADYRRRLDGQRSTVSQTELDSMMASLRPTAVDAALPKGLSAGTLELVRESLARVGTASAAEVAERTGTSRVTARRYLEYLGTLDLVRRVSRHGTAGRPEIDYVWRG
ncbi:MAG: response regulator [Propionibacteriaceae bacterium]